MPDNKQALIPGGYFIVPRQIIESDIYKKPPLYLKVWLYILARTQHDAYKGLKRGQTFLSIPEIIEAVSWKVGARTERPTRDQIFQIIEWLRKPDEGGNESNAKATAITTTKATHGMLINVDHYSFFQDSKNYESNDESNDENPTKPVRKQRQPDNINKNVLKNDNELNKKDIVSEVIQYLNEKTGKRFKADVAETVKFISGRISEGRTLDDFKYVIDVKTSHWLNDPKWDQYLRPQTLFAQSKFDNYLNQGPKQQGQQHFNFSSTSSKPVDPEVDARNRKIILDQAMNDWLKNGGDPDDFPGLE